MATAATAMLERLRDTAATVKVEEMVGARQVIRAIARAGSDPEPVPALEGPLRPLGSDCHITAMWALVLVIVVRNGAVSMDELTRMFRQE